LAWARQLAANPELARAVDLQAEALSAEWEARHVLLNTAPITVAGAVAVIRHASKDTEDARQWCGGFTDEYDLWLLISTVADGLARIA
jgi:hypothetical protein